MNQAPRVLPLCRRFALAVAGFSIGLAACGSDKVGGEVGEVIEVPGSQPEAVLCEAGEIDGDLNLYNWIDYIDPRLIALFEEEFGVDVVQDFYDSNEAMLAKLQSGAAYDLIVPSDYMVWIMIQENILAAVQRDAVPNLDNLAPFFADPSYDPGGVYSIAYQWGTTGLAVDMGVLGKDFEATWGLVFDPDTIDDYSGGVSLLNDPRETMGAALKYLGYSLNSTSEAELQEAADVIAAAKEFVSRFDSDLYDERLVAGEVAVAHGHSGTFFATFDDIDGWDTYAFVIPDEGAALWIDNMAVPSTAEHPCTAHTFMDFVLDAENGATLSNFNSYASPNQAAEAFIDPEILEDETIHPSEELSDLLEVIADTGGFEMQYTDYFAIAKS